VVTAVPGALNTPVVVAVTFPAGRFTLAPSLVTTCGGGSPHQIASSWTAVNAAGANIIGVKTAGSLTALTINYIALQNVTVSP